MNKKGIVKTLVLLMLLPAAVSSHPIWKQRNHTGPWTVVLYHFDEEDVQPGNLLRTETGVEDLHLFIRETGGDGLLSTVDVPREVLLRSLLSSSPQSLIAEGEVAHPTQEMSIELWLRFAEFNVDVQFGFLNGVSLRMRIGEAGDRFQLIGANTMNLETTDYSAPGFMSFPPVNDWHHYGVTITAPNIETLPNGNLRYGDGSIAKFFFDSHIVGFQGNQTLDLSGLEFSPNAQPAIIIRTGTFLFDEFMISSVDWSVPTGHGGTGHSGTRLEHGFEDGRAPAALHNWQLF